MSSGMSRGWAAVLCCLCLSVPIVAVQFPPVTDLPQQAAQIRLFLQVIDKETDSDEYTIQWTKPGNASYLILGGSWALFGPGNAGRVALLVAVLLWVISLQLFAAKFLRPLAGTILGSILVYNSVLYWGFLNFMLGLPAFMFLVYILKSYSVRTWRGALAWTAGAFLLYSAHVLWLIFGAAYVTVHGLLRGGNRSDTLLHMAVFSPFVLLAVWWSSILSHSIMDASTRWTLIPFVERLAPKVVAPALFGSLPGPIPYLYAGILVAYLLVVIVSTRKSLWKEIDRDLLLASGLLLLAAQVLPDIQTATILFAERWLAPALALLLLALPRAPFKPYLIEVSLCVLVGLYGFVTAERWTEFQRRDMSGLVQAIDGLPTNPSVFGVADDPRGTVVAGYPLLHAYAYAQVIKGGTLNVSFAHYPSSLVTFAGAHELDLLMMMHLTLRQLPSYPLISRFDYALVGANDSYHEHLKTRDDLRAETLSGYWRLYRIAHH